MKIPLICCCLAIATLSHAEEVTRLVDFSDRPLDILTFSVLVTDSSRNGHFTFITDLDTPGHRELYNVPLDGSSPPNKLSGSETQYGIQLLSPVSSSPAVTYIAWPVPEEFNNLYNLYYVPRDGSAPPLQLNPPIPADERIGNARYNSTGSHVMFTVSNIVTGPYKLLSVPVNNPDNWTELVGTGFESYVSGIYSDIAIFLADSSLLDPQPAEPDFLASVPVDSSAPYTFLAGVDNALIVSHSEESHIVVFISDGDFYAVPDNGSTQAYLIAEVEGAGGTLERYKVSPDGRYLLYRADMTDDSNTSYNLYSVPTDGSQPTSTLISDQHFYSSNRVQTNDMTIDPTNTRVAFFVNADTQGYFEIYTANIDGTDDPTHFYGPFLDGYIFRFYFSDVPNDQIVLGIRDQPDRNSVLAQANFQGGEPILPIDGTDNYAVGSSTVLHMQIDGKRVLYYTTKDDTDSFWIIPDLDNPQPILIDPFLPDGNIMRRIQINPYNDHLFYTAGLADDQITAAYITDLSLLIIQATLQPPSINFNGSDIIITWDAMAEVTLQQCEDLASGTWTDVPGTEGESSYTVQPDGTQTFYRLIYRKQEL